MAQPTDQAMCSPGRVEDDEKQQIGNDSVKPRTETEKNMTLSKLRKTALAIALLASSLLLTTGPVDAATRVTVNSRGDITITGDNSTQVVRLGVDSAGELVATIHNGQGQEQATYYIGSDYRDLRVNLRGGNDGLIVESSGRPVFRRVTVNLGSGHNTAGLQNAEITDRLTIVDGSGNADVILNNVALFGLATVNLGGGANLFEARATRVHDRFTASTSPSGQLDALFFDHAQYGGAFTVRGGNKSDTLNIRQFYIATSPILIDLKAGADRLAIENLDTFGNGNIRLGSGNDVAEMEVVMVHGNLTFRGDAGNDSFTSTSSDYRQATVHGGSGIDSFTSFGDFSQAVLTSIENS